MRERIDKLEECVKLFGRSVKALHRSKIGNVGVKDLKIRRMEIFNRKRSRRFAKIGKI